MLKTTDKYFNMTGMFKTALTDRLNALHAEDQSFGDKFTIDTPHHSWAGGRIGDIQQLINETVETRAAKGEVPSRVGILCYDSDLEDLKNLQLEKDKAGYYAFLVNYRRLLEDIILYMKKWRFDHQIIVGPALYGPKGEMPEDWPKEVFVDDLVAVNKEVCTKHGASHIDTRKAFQEIILKSSIPPKNLKDFRGKQWPKALEEQSGYGGILTFDGDHANYAGTKVVVNMIADEVAGYSDIWGTPAAIENVYSSLNNRESVVSIDLESQALEEGSRTGSISLFIDRPILVVAFLCILFAIGVEGKRFTQRNDMNKDSEDTVDFDREIILVDMSESSIDSSLRGSMHRIHSSDPDFLSSSASNAVSPTTHNSNSRSPLDVSKVSSSPSVQQQPTNLPIVIAKNKLAPEKHD